MYVICAESREEVEQNLERFNVILPYSGGIMIPNSPSSFSPVKVSSGIFASWSIFVESTKNMK